MPPELFRSTPFSDSSRRLNCEEIAESTDLKNTNEGRAVADKIDQALQKLAAKHDLQEQQAASR
jgi:hypothetical protein